MSAQTSAAPVVRRDRLILLAAASLVVALAWAYLLRAPGHSSAEHALMPHAGSFDAATLLMSFFMWMAMMIGMMLPVVMPWILVFATIDRDRTPQRAPYLPGAAFTGGYFAIWSLYSLLGAFVQLALQQRSWLDAGLTTTTAIAGALLIAAGLFQFSALKEACLAHCRTPIGFFLERWRDGPSGAFGMGFRHGVYCVGCCWALMALMFAAGVMNLLWMAVLAVVMLAEQLAPRRLRLARVFGVVLVVWGGALIFSAG